MAKAKKQPKNQDDDFQDTKSPNEEQVEVGDDVSPSDDEIASTSEEIVPSDDAIVVDTDEGFEIGTIVADTPEANEDEEEIDLSKANELDPSIYDENFDYEVGEGDDFLGDEDYDDEGVDDYDEAY